MLTSGHSRSPTSIFTFDVVDLRISKIGMAKGKQLGCLAHAAVLVEKTWRSLDHTLPVSAAPRMLQHCVCGGGANLKHQPPPV